MSFLGKIRVIVENFANVRIFRKLPFGISFLDDIQYILNDYNYAPKMIFDVGANVGQFLDKVCHQLKEYDVHSFEMSKASFLELENKYKSIENVTTYHMALGAEEGVVDISLGEDSTMNAILTDNLIKGGKENVKMRTVDNICNEYGIEKIDFLKIDTEGYDLKVLKGADKMLKDKRISIVQVEVGMNPRNQYHVPFEEIKSYLEERNFYVFGIYNQVQEWRLSQPVLRVCDCVFVSKDFITAHTPSRKSWF